MSDLKKIYLLFLIIFLELCKFSSILCLFLNHSILWNICQFFMFFLLWRLGALQHENNFHLALLKINSHSMEKLTVDHNRPFGCCFCYFHLLPQEGWLSNKLCLCLHHKTERKWDVSKNAVWDGHVQQYYLWLKGSYQYVGVSAHISDEFGIVALVVSSSRMLLLKLRCSLRTIVSVVLIYSLMQSELDLQAKIGLCWSSLQHWETIVCFNL